jgi:tRNA A22 N-methylase
MKAMFIVYFQFICSSATNRLVLRQSRAILTEPPWLDFKRSAAKLAFNFRCVGFRHNAVSPSFQWHTKQSISSSAICNQHLNRYDRFRVSLKSKLQPNVEDRAQDLMAVAKTTMEMLSSNRRAFNRTWARMCPLIELIVAASRDCNSVNDDTTKLKSIADVGCDHGLLSLSLASMAAWSSSQSNTNTGFLTKVTGSDLSSNALRSGALLSLEKINDSISRMPKADDEGGINNLQNSTIKLPIDFRLGSGLSTLQPGDACGVILAGMGVHTMIEILTGSNDLTMLDTNHLFLQPTNSRPRHLLMLYDALRDKWRLMDENIVYLGGRWYINSYFKRSVESERSFPGHFLMNNEGSSSMKATYESYVRHHIQWLKKDHEKRGTIEVDDRKWLQYICNNGANDDTVCDWYHQFLSNQ